MLNMLSEASTVGISQAEKPEGMPENLAAAQRSGRVAGNAKTMRLITDVIEGAAELEGKEE